MKQPGTKPATADPKSFLSVLDPPARTAFPSSEAWVESTDPADTRWLEQNVPCQAACPIRTNIPGYIEAMIRGDLETAYRINRRDNIFPGVLGRVCHRPCEPVCRHARPGLGEAVQICFLKRSAADFGLKPVNEKCPDNGMSICVVGAGPAGLTAANDLAFLGYRVTVIEQYEEAGGMLRYGIPAFRLPPEVVQKDIDAIVDLGITLRTAERLDKEKDLARLKKEFDAVIVAGGCMLATQADLPGMDADGFFWGLDFMMDVNRGLLQLKPKEVVVIGGGFTAVDCARTAYRLGAKKVTLAYRRTADYLRVGKQEVAALDHEGIETDFLASPVEVETKDGRVTGLTLIRNAIDENGRLTPQDGSTFTIPGDTVILAIGQSSEELKGIPTKPNKDPIEQEGVYFAGDFRTGSGTVIEACADGRTTAREVHEALSGEGFEETAEIEAVELEDLPRWREHDFIPPEPMPELDLKKRKSQVREVEQGFSRVQALVEAHRCYLCHYNYQIDVERCIYCMKCIDVMPVDCIHLIESVEEKEPGVLRYVPAESWDRVQAIAVDNDRCIRCGNCVRACPVDCISVTRYSRRLRKKTNGTSAQSVAEAEEGRG